MGGSNAPRGAVATAGVGSFVYGTLTVTAYGCYRSGTRVLCDFDLSNQTNMQASVGYFNNIALVDNGGKMTARHSAFFMGDDGTQFDTAYISQGKPVRYMMEYDDVSQNYNSVSLVWGQNQIQNVPVVSPDPNQPAGTIPARGAPQPGAGQAVAGQTGAPAAAGAPVDQANSALNNAQNQKAKAKSFWQQMKDTAAAAKTTANPKQ